MTKPLFATRIADWRIADGCHGDLSAAQMRPWDVAVSRGGYGGLLLTFEAPDGSKKVASIEIDKGNVTILAFRDEMSDPDAKMTIAPDGVHVTSSVEDQRNPHIVFTERGQHLSTAPIPDANDATAGDAA